VDSLLAWAGLRYYVKMRIQCGAAAAAVAYCADEATTSATRGLPLYGAATVLPCYDVCYERPTFIFYVEDRALV
jgi:hypothetical protein